MSKKREEKRREEEKLDIDSAAVRNPSPTAAVGLVDGEIKSVSTSTVPQSTEHGAAMGDGSASGSPDTSPRQPPTAPSPLTSPPLRRSRRGRSPSALLPTSHVAPAAGVTPTARKSAKRMRKASKLDPSLPPPQPQAESRETDLVEGLAEKHLSSDSSAISSPLREPPPPVVPRWTDFDGTIIYDFSEDPVVMNKYTKDVHDYMEIKARQHRLPTLSHSKVSGLSEPYNPKQKIRLLDAAKSVLILSAYQDGKKINRCSGIVFGRNEVKHSTVILTSAWIISTTQPFNDWSDKDYVPEAKVVVHLLDGTTSEGQLLYFNKHYDFAFFEITGGSHLPVLSLEESSSESGKNLYIVARDKNLEFVCRRASVKFRDPFGLEHNHYQFVDGSIPRCSTGGALLDLDGKIIGMLFKRLPHVAFVSSSLILKCFSTWRKFGRVARPQLGLKLRNVGFLDISQLELLSRDFGIDSGLVVGEVLEESVAEKHGIRDGDVILSCEGERVLSIIELEHVLLSIGERYLENNDLNSTVDVKVGVYHMSRRKRKTISLTVELSYGVEVFQRGISD